MQNPCTGVCVCSLTQQRHLHHRETHQRGVCTTALPLPFPQAAVVQEPHRPGVRIFLSSHRVVEKRIEVEGNASRQRTFTWFRNHSVEAFHTDRADDRYVISQKAAAKKKAHECYAAGGGAAVTGRPQRAIIPARATIACFFRSSEIA